MYKYLLKVNFDKSKHLSDASVNRRQIIRDRFVKKEKERLEAEMKEKKKEEKRKEEERLSILSYLYDESK